MFNPNKNINTPFLLLVSLLLFLCVFSFSTNNIPFVDALLGPNITLKLTDPGTFSTTFSPRRIAVQVNITFSKRSNVIGPIEAIIPQTNWSAKCKMTRFYWYQAGTLNTVTNSYSITFRNPILTWNGFEYDAFRAMDTINMTIGASSSAKIINSTVCVYFERLVVKYIDSTVRLFQTAYTMCYVTNKGFLITLLKPYDESVIASLVPATGDYWSGAWYDDLRNQPTRPDSTAQAGDPLKTMVCWKGDPDYEESGCFYNKTGGYGGYYSHFRIGDSTDGTTNTNCARPQGFACRASDLDWDDNGCGYGNTAPLNVGKDLFNCRFRYVSAAVGWIFWDRSTNCSQTMGHICCDIVSYTNVAGSGCHRPTITLTRETMTLSQTGDRSYSLTDTADRSTTLSDTDDRTISMSWTPDDSTSFTHSRTYTVTADHTASESGTPDRTYTITRSKGTRTGTIDKSASQTWTPDDSATLSRSKSRTATAGKSASMTWTADDTLTLTHGSRTRSLTGAESASASFTADDSTSLTVSWSRSATASITADRTRSGTETADKTRSFTLTKLRTRSASDTMDKTASASFTADETRSGTLSDSRSATISATASKSQSISVTKTGSATESGTSQKTRTGSDTADESRSVSVSRTETATESSTAGRTATESRTIPDTPSKTRTGDRTSSFSLSLVDTPSRTRTADRSASFTLTADKSGSFTRSTSLSFTPDKSRSNSISAAITVSPSFTADATQSVTVSTSRSPPETRTKTRTHTRESKTKVATLSTTETITGGTPTVTFQFWYSCPENWVSFGDLCFKHFSSITSREFRPNETLPTQLTFDEALSFCQVEHKATIYPILNYAMMLFLRDLVGQNSGINFWNGVYQDVRYQDGSGHHYSAPTSAAVWRTVYNRTGFKDFFWWDQRRGMPHLTEDCITYHVAGDLSRRIVGGNDAMISFPCNSRADVVCGRQRDGWTITAVNKTTSGVLFAAEDRPLRLLIVGKNLPRNFGVQLQTTTFKTHSGDEGQPTHCTQSRLRAKLYMNESATPAFGKNISKLISFHPHCNGTCSQAYVDFPPPNKLNLQRGFKYSLCFFLPFDYAVPLSSDEFRWDFFPDLYVEVGIRERTYLEETCERHQQLVDLLYMDPTATDKSRVVESPWYFDGPVVKDPPAGNVKYN